MKVIQLDQSYGEINLKTIIKDKNFKKFSEIAKLIQFNMDIINIQNIVYHTGIHIRLTDMNKGHGPQYGIINWDDYSKFILNYLNNVDNKVYLFVSSDNLESINKIKI